jgi:hypothetical protein
LYYITTALQQNPKVCSDYADNSYESYETGNSKLVDTMEKNQMKRLLAEYCDLKMQMKAMGEQIAEMNAVIKDHPKLAASIEGFVVNITEVETEGVSLPVLRDELSEKVFAKHIQPLIKESSYTRLVVNRTAQENLITILPSMQRRAR